MTEPVALRDVAASTGEQLGAAADHLDRGGSGFVLGPMRVRVRGEAGLTDGEVGLNPDPAASAAISELSLTFVPGRGVVPTATLPPAPDVVGYTSALALRKLEAAGLSGDLLRRVVTDPSQAGRVVDQSAPSPGGVVTLQIGMAAAPH